MMVRGFADASTTRNLPQRVMAIQRVQLTRAAVENRMKQRFRRNIDNSGRIVRGAMAAVLLIAAGLLGNRLPIVATALVFTAAFLAFEALRGWCAVRACGIRTKL
jgi:hypothetical protein